MYGNTSLIIILSSEHGRLRREQRDIDKRDLKYGQKAKAWGQRYRIEYDGIVYIVDKSLRHEITSFPALLVMANPDLSQRLAHTNALKILRIKPELVVSHTCPGSRQQRIHEHTQYLPTPRSSDGSLLNGSARVYH